jgi:hypothetical protein
MSRAVIVATIVTSILAFSSPSIAASKKEVGRFGTKMSDAFKCAIYAADSHDLKEQQRLFQIGLKAARDFVEGLKSLKDSPYNDLQTYMPGATTDLLVGQMWGEQSKQAEDDVRKGLSPERMRKHEAERFYRERNCSLIN